MPFKQNVIERIEENDRTLTLIERGAWSNYLTEADIEVLIDSIKIGENKFLNTLELDDNEIGDNGALLLSSLETIKVLQVAESDITAIGAEYLSKMKSLLSLSVSLNQIGDEGFAALVGSTSIVSLDASHCGITSKGAEAVLNNTHITFLSLEGNDIEDVVLQKIDAHIARNRQKAEDELSSEINRVEKKSLEKLSLDEHSGFLQKRIEPSVSSEGIFGQNLPKSNERQTLNNNERVREAGSPVISSSHQFWSGSPMEQRQLENNQNNVKIDLTAFVDICNTQVQLLNNLLSQLPPDTLKEYPEYQNKLPNITMQQRTLGKKQ